MRTSSGPNVTVLTPCVYAERGGGAASPAQPVGAESVTGLASLTRPQRLFPRPRVRSPRSLWPKVPFLKHRRGQKKSSIRPLLVSFQGALLTSQIRPWLQRPPGLGSLSPSLIVTPGSHKSPSTAATFLPALPCSGAPAPAASALISARRLRPNSAPNPSSPHVSPSPFLKSRESAGSSLK